jgi:tetratricopeptide (TPR) repeat protein
MAQVTCSRCFTVFEAEDGSPGAAPLCPACARRAPAAARLPIAPLEGGRRAPRARGGRRIGRLALAAGAVALLAGGAAAWVLLRRPAEAPAAPTVVELRVAEWRTAGLLPAQALRDAGLATARVEAGLAALAADLPPRTTEALRSFREALAAAPRRADAAIAGYATAFAESVGEDASGAELRATHDMVHDALAAGPRPDLQAAYARLLLLVPSPANDAEALAVATKAVAAAPRDASARLALGLAEARQDPAGAARLLEEAAAALPADRRLLTAAARARWAAGDAAQALALADRRLALDPAAPGALALRAEVLAASDRIADARAVLERWAAAEPSAALPHLLLARLAYQRDDDLATARRHLDAALERRPDDFTAARALAHRSAVELAAGDTAAAEAAVAEALRRVPASAPARFQAAVLAFRRGDAPGLRESAGVLGERAGAVVAKLLAARSAELSGTDEEAQQAYATLVALAPRDPSVLLATAGALARMRSGGPAVDVARRALERDVVEGRLRHPPTDYWEGAAPLVEASRRLEVIASVESRGGATAFAGAAACEVLLGRTVAAERLAKLAAAASPQAPAPHALLAQVALDRGDARRALAHAAAAVEARALDPVALVARARALEGLGRNLDAEQAYRAAAEAGADLVTPRLGLARLLARRGETREAAGLLEPLLREDPSLAEVRGALLLLAPTTPPKPAAP